MSEYDDSQDNYMWKTDFTHSIVLTDAKIALYFDPEITILIEGKTILPSNVVSLDDYRKKKDEI